MDLASLAAAISGRKLATFAAGFLAAVAVAEQWPERWAGVCAALAGGIAGWAAVALGGGSAAASVQRDARKTEDGRRNSGSDE